MGENVVLPIGIDWQGDLRAVQRAADLSLIHGEHESLLYFFPIFLSIMHYLLEVEIAVFHTVIHNCWRSQPDIGNYVLFAKR